MTQTKISTNKIFLIVLAVCATLVAVLFIFHLYEKPTATRSSNDSFMFNNANDIKPFELYGTKGNFTQANLLNHWTLVFFGFTHCAKVCPTTLGMLKDAYPALHAKYPNLQIVLVSLDPERDTPSVLKAYTERFNSDFIGVTGKLEQLRRLQAQLHIYSSREAQQGNESYQIQHTSSILLVNPQGKWAGIFSYGMSPAQFVKTFKKSVYSLGPHA